MYLLGRHENRRALTILLDLVIDLVFLQFGCHFTGVLGLHIGEQRHHIRLTAIPETDTQYGYEKCQSGAEHNVTLALAEPCQQLLIPLFPISHAFHPFA